MSALFPDYAYCYDCGVAPDAPHIDGCDVARCTLCGWQRISCGHFARDVGWGAVWTGEFPGCAEVRKGYGRDLNDLASRAHQGLLEWDQDAQEWRPRTGHGYRYG